MRGPSGRGAVSSPDSLRVERDADRRLLHLAAIVDASDDAIISNDLDGTIRSWNPAAERMYQYGASEVVGRNISMLAPPDRRHEAPAILERVAQGQHVRHYETVRVRKDGEALDVSLTVSPVFGDDGAVIGASTIDRDVTERKRLDDALRASEARLRMIAEAAHDLVVFRVCQDPLRVDYVSAGVEAVTGFSPREFYADPALARRRIPDEHRQRVEAALRGQSPDAVEIRFQHRDGAWVWLQVRAVPVSSDGRGVQAIEGIAHDITARKTAELALRTSESRFRALVQHAGDMILVVDAAGTVRYSSPATQRVIGREVDGEGVNVFEFVHPDDADRVEAALAAAGSTKGPTGPVAFRVAHSDFTWRHVEAIANNLLDDPAVQGVVVNARDVTERQRTQEQLAHQALHDDLTGLANRQLLMDRVSHALARMRREGGLVAVLFLDLDGFKDVNDRLGHLAGDRLLRTLGARLRGAVRPSDTVARPGGDEFVVLCEPLSGEDEALRIAERLLTAVREPFRIDDATLAVGASVGIAFARPHHRNAESLLADADVAMYRAKRRGKSRYEVFDEADQPDSSGRT